MEKSKSNRCIHNRFINPQIVRLTDSALYTLTNVAMFFNHFFYSVVEQCRRQQRSRAIEEQSEGRLRETEGFGFGIGIQQTQPHTNQASLLAVSLSSAIPILLVFDSSSTKIDPTQAALCQQHTFSGAHCHVNNPLWGWTKG